MNKIILSLFCLFSLTNIHAQTSFSTEPEVFIDEFTKFMSTPANAELKPIIESFSANWKAGKILPEQKKYIIKICNSMIYKSLSKDPYFDLFIKNIDLFYQKKLNDGILKQWQIIAKSLLEKNPKDYLSFLQFANNLFTDNTLFKIDNRRWYASNSNYELSFVNEKIGVTFKTLDLKCDAAMDKIIIKNCAGTFYPDKNQWIGTQGRINWERVGMSETEIYAEFYNHKIDMNTGGFTVDSAFLTYPKISKTRINGKLTEMISHTNSQDLVSNSPYPKFSSYNPSIEIKGIVGSEAIYKGGFSIEGKKTNSENFGNNLSTIILLYKGQPYVEVQSKAFKLDSGKVISQNTFIKIKVDTGYITHPNAIFNYNINTKKMTINKGSVGLTRMPFSDNYHGVEIDVDRIIWEQSKPYIEFDMTSKDQAAFVETNTFFKKFLFEKAQGALSMNPLEKLFAYARKNGRRFTLTDYITHLNTKREYVIQQLMDLSDNGFLYYTPENDSIFIKDKLYLWNSNAYGGRDYDVLRFRSVIGEKANITYSFNTKELVMQGVRRFTFSDSQNVVAVPTEQILTIRKDKTLQFGGLIQAGRIDFYSKDFNFDYQNFQINNTTIDSMVIFYPDVNTNSLRKVESVLSNTYGRILIDKPNNKSGLKDHPEYPIFIAERGSEINYDRAQTHNHAYKADKFVFEIDPFEIDSLDNFTIAGFGFGGTLKSDGIFPDIKNVARIQPDYSLGFIDHVNLPMYGGKGTGDLTINLSNRGFYGVGDLIYETSVSKSTEYLLLPDATVGNSFSFHLPESAKYPLVDGHNVRTEWYPKQDKMFQTKLDSNFRVFKMQYAFDGKMTLSPKDLRGNGQLKWSEALFSSDEMVYGRNKVNADVSRIQIFAVDPSKFAFDSRNMKGNIDFDKREGKFTTNQMGAMTDFPYNRYSSNMNDYKWDMNKKTMEIKPNAAMASLKPMFVGLPPNVQDSVKFECHYAKFDLVNNVLFMEKIPHIDVADSRVFPFDGKAVVRENAVMDVLDSSRIVANRIDKFHEIKNCKTKILGGNSLAATGFYRYIDKYKQEQPLIVDSIRINKENHLVGYGRIEESKILNLDKKIGFKGMFEIISTSRPINFIGYVRPMHNFAKMETLWLRYQEEVDPQNVVINVLDPRDKDNKRLSIGLYFANDSNHVYPILFDLKRRYSDPELQSDTGILYYDNTLDAFMIGNEDKLLNKGLKGNYIQFNEKDQSVYTEGRYDFQIESPKVSIQSAGNANLAAGDSTFRFNLTMLMDFPFPAEIKDKLSKLFTNENAGGTTGSLNNVETKMAIHELISDPKDVVKMIKALETNKVIIPEGEFKSGFVFTGVELAFERIRRKFISSGTFTLALCNGTVVNKTFTASIVIEKRRTGDKIYLYIVNDAGEWFYMDYYRGSVTLASNNDELNAAINTEANKMADEQFIIRVGSERTKDNFLRKNDVEE